MHVDGGEPRTTPLKAAIAAPPKRVIIQREHGSSRTAESVVAVGWDTPPEASALECAASPTESHPPTIPASIWIVVAHTCSYHPTCSAAGQHRTNQPRLASLGASPSLVAPTSAFDTPPACASTLRT
ncbi:hypothetical protein L1887_59074 [Cichorium endivia]|nr:hypothetical protein L1887_59074 [Cichorium endivia]